MQKRRPWCDRDELSVSILKSGGVNAKGQNVSCCNRCSDGVCVFVCFVGAESTKMERNFICTHIEHKILL